MKNTILFAFLLGFCVLGGPGAATAMPTPQKATQEAPRTPVFGAETMTLSNGMMVVVIPNHRTPVVTHMVWYKIGAMDEAQGKTGLAHFLEHLMFKGSPNVPPGALSKRVKELGGNDNAFTTQDYTAYFQTVAVQHLETVMTMEADRMKAILVPEDEFESERQVVLEERRQNTENDPRSYFYEQVRYALFPGHPYGRPVIGWKADIDALTRQEALDWHDNWYTPNNAILVISGDVTLEQVKPMAEKIYGSIPARPMKRPAFSSIADFPGTATLTLKDPRIHQEEAFRLYRAPSFAMNRTDALALSLLEEIMDGNSSTRLYQSIVVNQKLATQADLSYSGSSIGPGTISISIVPANNIDIGTIEAAIMDEVKKLADTGPDADELQSAKQRMIDSAAFARDSIIGPAKIVGFGLATGLMLDNIEYWPYDIEAVTAEQIQSVARTYLLGNDGATPVSVQGVILPADQPDHGNKDTSDNEENSHE